MEWHALVNLFFLPCVNINYGTFSKSPLAFSNSFKITNAYGELGHYLPK